MNANKIIIRAFLTTLASVALLFLFMVGALVCVYPQSMMKISYNLGMENSSIWFAEVSYDRSKDVYYIAYATEVAIGEKDYKKIDACGSRMIKDKAFMGYCEERNGDASVSNSLAYEHYVYGQVCIAKYKRNKANDAIALAFESVGNAFPKNNAVVAMLVTALQTEDVETVAVIKGKMEELKMANEMSVEDGEYFDAVFKLLQSE